MNIAETKTMSLDTKFNSQNHQNNFQKTNTKTRPKLFFLNDRILYKKLARS